MGDWRGRAASGKPLLLVVDDADFDLRQWQLMFQARGYEVITKKAKDDFLDSTELAEIIRDEKPDCILTDFNMNGLTAADTLDAVKLAQSSAPVILHSKDLDKASMHFKVPTAELTGPALFHATHEKGDVRQIDADFRQHLNLSHSRSPQ